MAAGAGVCVCTCWCRCVSVCVVMSRFLCGGIVFLRCLSVPASVCRCRVHVRMFISHVSCHVHDVEIARRPVSRQTFAAKLSSASSRLEASVASSRAGASGTGQDQMVSCGSWGR